jgi:hypothetical protein
VRFWRALKARGRATASISCLTPSSARRCCASWPGPLRRAAARHTVTGAKHRCVAGSRALFDRSDDYADFIRSLANARKTISGHSTGDLTRLLRRLRKDFEAIVAIDDWTGLEAGCVSS